MFGFSNKNKVNNTNKNATSKWDTLLDVDNKVESIQEKQDRQRNKLAAALLHEDATYLGAERVNISDADINKVIKKIANGSIDSEQEFIMIDSIRPPILSKGANEVMGVIAQNNHERKILAYMTGKDLDSVHPDNVASFMEKYPNPFNFESAKQNFLEMIAQNNSEAKYQQYVRDMNAFCHDMYGKRQEYYERMLELNEMAANLNVPRTPFLDKAGAVLPKSALVEGLGGKPSGDAIYEDEDGFMALFDGVGSTADDSSASNACKNALPSLINQVDFSSAKGREELVTRLNAQLLPGDATTCVISQTVRNSDGTSTLNYVSVGDSRLYVVRKGQAMQITRDDSVTDEMLDQRRITDPATRKRFRLHGISNSLGDGFTGQISPGNNGSLILYPGDYVVLCSDGITGDVEQSDLDENDIAQGKRADVMYASELAQIVDNTMSCQKAAQDLIRNAKKNDDRSALVGWIR